MKYRHFRGYGQGIYYRFTTFEERALICAAPREPDARRGQHTDRPHTMTISYTDHNGVSSLPARWRKGTPLFYALYYAVVVGFAVPLICQPFAAPIGGSSDSRTTHAPLDDLNGTVKNCYLLFLLPPQSAVGGIDQRKRNRRKADVPFLLAHMGFGDGTSPSRPKDATSPRQGARHRTRCISAP